MLFSEIAGVVAEGKYDAGVLIHEGRFVYERYNLELVADLGVEWEKKTGLPLPLGSIVARRDMDVEVVERMERVLRRSIEYAFSNPMVSRDYVKEHAQELDDRVIDSHIALFVNDFSLSLGEEGRRAVAMLTDLDI
jgi:1,4-dihydroxy-6-naphthoate synthase